MQFARVSGTLSVSSLEPDRQTGRGRLLVTLDTGHRVETVRDEVVALLPSPDARTDVGWSADQYTQETIAVDLAELGWEVFGMAEDDGGASPSRGVGVSATFLVRRAGTPVSEVSDPKGGQ